MTNRKRKRRRKQVKGGGATHWSSLILTNPSHPDTTMPSVAHTRVCVFVCVIEIEETVTKEQGDRNGYRQGLYIFMT